MDTKTTSQPTATIASSTSTQRFSNVIIHRLNQLNHSTSKESIQTFTKWILFHANNHPNSIQQTLKQMYQLNNWDDSSKSDDKDDKDDDDDVRNSNSNEAMISSSSNRSSLISRMDKWSSMLNVHWNILHEICYNYSSIAIGGGDEQKWSNHTEFRSSLAENVIVPLLDEIVTLLEVNASSTSSTHMSSNHIYGNFGSLPSFQNSVIYSIKELRDKLDNMHSIWEDVDSFQSPTLLDDIKKRIVKILQFEFVDGGGIVNNNIDSSSIEEDNHVQKVVDGVGTNVHVSSSSTASTSKDTDQVGVMVSTSTHSEEMKDVDENNTGAEKSQAQTEKLNQTDESQTGDSVQTKVVVDAEKITDISSNIDHFTDGATTPTPSMDDNDNDEFDLFGDDTEMGDANDSSPKTEQENVDENSSKGDTSEVHEAMTIDDTTEVKNESNVGDDDDGGNGKTDKNEKKRSASDLNNQEIDFEAEVSFIYCMLQK